MTDFCVWLERVLVQGESVQTSIPLFEPHDRSRSSEILHRVFKTFALDVAGPPIPFDAEAAFFGAKNLACASWRIASGDPEPMLDWDREPDSPSAHLSADVSLRLLPAVYRRAKTHGSDYPLVKELEKILRAWPLSGVLVDLDGSPTVSIDFSGHIGLQQRYAERLLTFGRAGWVPQDGSAAEWTEVIFSERGRTVPKPVQISES